MTSQQNEKSQHQMTVRLPETLVGQLRQLADAHKRSLRGEIEVALEMYVQQEQMKKKA